MYGLGYFSEKKRYQRTKKRYKKEQAQEKRYKTRLEEARLRRKIGKEKSELFNLEHPHLASLGRHATRTAKKHGRRALRHTFSWA